MMDDGSVTNSEPWVIFMDIVQLEVHPREVLGKKVARLRRQALTPVHLYGKGLVPASLQADTQALMRVLVQVGKTSPVSLRVSGEDHFTFVREIQRQPVTGQILHVDFYQVPITERMQSAVPITLVGEAPAVRLGGGYLLHAIHHIDIESLPTEVPPAIEVDVSLLDDFEKAVHVSSISLGPNVTILTDPEAVVARVQPPRAKEIEEVPGDSGEDASEEASAGGSGEEPGTG